MPEQKPKIQFPTNIPVTVRLGQQFWSGEGQYGMSYGWNMIQDGVEKSCFVKPYLNDKIKGFPAGTELTITKNEVLGEGGRPRTEWLVVPAGYTQPLTPPQSFAPPNGQQATQRPNTPQQSAIGSWDRDEYRAERRARAEEALQDAEKIMNPEIWSREDVRALAISFLIDEQHKGIAPPDIGF